MCHGRIAPKSTAALAVASAGHGVFLPLVILSTLLGDSLASGGFGPASLGGEGKDSSHCFSQSWDRGLSYLAASCSESREEWWAFVLWNSRGPVLGVWQ